MNANVDLDFLDQGTVGTTNDRDGWVGSIQRHETDRIEERVATTRIASYSGDSKQLQVGMMKCHQQCHSIVVSRIAVEPYRLDQDIVSW